MPRGRGSRRRDPTPSPPRCAAASSPVPRPAALGARFARPGALVGGDEVAHGACLVRQLRRDDRTLRGVRHGTEDVVPAPRLNRVAGVVALPGLERAPLVAHRNAGRGAATFGHENQANAERPETLRLRHDVGKRVVSLAVGEHDHDPIRELGPRADQLPALPQRPRQSGTALGRDPWVERIEVQPERRAVDRERRQDVARPCEHHEPQMIAVQVRHQPAGLAYGAAQAARAHILGEHRARDVDREREREAARLRHDVLFPPAGTGERDEAQKGGDGERRRSEPSGCERGPYRLLGPQGGATDPSAPGPRGPEPDRAAQQRREREYHGRVEANQGTRTASVAANTISSPSATRPSASGTRYDSSNRRYTTCCTVSFSSRLISSNTCRSDCVSVARKYRPPVIRAISVMSGSSISTGIIW